MRLILLLAVVAAALVLFFSNGRRDDASSPSPDVAQAELSGVGGMVDPTSEEPPVVASNTGQPSGDRASSHPGYAVYKKRGCSVCHGRNLQGTRMGPTLTDTAEHFDRDTMTRYLSNPDSAVAVTPRLAKLEEKFSMFVMPSFELPANEMESLLDLLFRAQN